MRLTKEQVKKMIPGQRLVVNCTDTAELDSAYQTALQARKEIEGYRVAISRSGKTMTVSISVSEKGDTT